ncbi:MAG: sporulation protein YabP [Candidatus Improbicoccus pseudotrichonymphae]|uniref:Sporulation protein YabP n=1 Tax=Candidatus Improbicoccus pseudotrichonymphae TaxID=3033792 RepID=A0AA48I433_9FIRM|nr:MAG: sporulation protein YabP [Candidatus Improbicoccus pseudotrichonymphae]
MNAESKVKHVLVLENKQFLKLNGVNELGRFDDRCVSVFTKDDKLSLCGSNLKIEKFCVGTGELEISGKIFSITYSDRKNILNKGIFSKIFGK